MFNFFKKAGRINELPFMVDIHSHLIPGIDDGVRSDAESLYILNTFIKMGYKKVITTPHVKMDQYPNQASDILSGAAIIQKLIEQHNLPVSFEAAAEYFLDDNLMSALDNDEPLLTFGDKYLLFETSFLNKPAFIEEAIFKMNINGYKPVFAHPERYIYVQSDYKIIEQLKNMNLFFQVNLLSLAGYYSSTAKKTALRLLADGVIDFAGSDCHNGLQADELYKAIPAINKCFYGKSKLLNHQLFT